MISHQAWLILTGNVKYNLAEFNLFACELRLQVSATLLLKLLLIGCHHSSVTLGIVKRMATGGEEVEGGE